MDQVEDLSSVTVVISGVTHTLLMRTEDLSKVYSQWVDWWMDSPDSLVIVALNGYIDSRESGAVTVSAPCSEITAWTVSQA